MLQEAYIYEVDTKKVITSFFSMQWLVAFPILAFGEEDKKKESS